ncbi:MAG: hypothetical protein WC667_11715 [Sulfurimonas sp.]|jgi:hypothetical protein
MNTLYFPPSALGFNKHLLVADTLAIVQQQLEAKNPNTGLVKNKLQIVINILLEAFNQDSPVMKTLKKWNQKTKNKKFRLFVAALADDFAHLSDAEYRIYGDIYYDLDSRYLSEKEFKASNSSISGWD